LSLPAPPLKTSPAVSDCQYIVAPLGVGDEDVARHRGFQEGSAFAVVIDDVVQAVLRQVDPEGFRVIAVQVRVAAVRRTIIPVAGVHAHVEDQIAAAVDVRDVRRDRHRVVVLEGDDIAAAQVEGLVVKRDLAEEAEVQAHPDEGI